MKSGTSGNRTPDALLLVAGVAYWTYVNLMFSFPTGSPSAGAVFDPTWFTIIGNLASLGLLAIPPCRAGDAVRQQALVALSCVAVLLGTCMLGLVGLGMLHANLLPLAGFFGGMGQGFSLVFFAELFACLPPSRVLLFSGVQQAAAVAPYLLLESLPAPAMLPVVAALVLVQYGCLVALVRRTGGPREAPPAARPAAHNRVILAVIAVAALFVGVCYGFTVSFTAAQDARGLPPVNVIGMLVGGGLLVLSALLFRRMRVGEHFYRIVVPLLSAGLAAIPLLAGSVAVALPILIAVGSYFFGLCWFITAFVSARAGIPATRMAALLFLCWEIGHLCARSLFSLVPATLETAGDISVVMLVAIIVFLVVCLPYQNRYEVRLDRETEALRRSIACDALAGDLELTHRERDVLRLLAAGAPAKDISSSLTLSEATVNTHIRHIYAKACVHTRGELDSLLVDRAAHVDLDAGPPAPAEESHR